MLKILSIINMITKDINKYGANQNMENFGKNQDSFNLEDVGNLKQHDFNMDEQRWKDYNKEQSKKKNKRK